MLVAPLTTLDCQRWNGEDQSYLRHVNAGLGILSWMKEEGHRRHCPAGERPA